MNTKQWLSRARRIDTEINSMLISYEETKAALTKVSQTLTGDTVQSTKDPHKFDRLAELSELIDRKVDELITVKGETVAAIGCLRNGNQRAVLYRRYIGNETFEQIAVGMNYSYKQVCRIHGRALIEMEAILHAEAGA